MYKLGVVHAKLISLLVIGALIIFSVMQTKHLYITPYLLCLAEGSFLASLCVLVS